MGELDTRLATSPFLSLTHTLSFTLSHTHSLLRLTHSLSHTHVLPFSHTQANTLLTSLFLSVFQMQVISFTHILSIFLFISPILFLSLSLSNSLSHTLVPSFSHTHTHNHISCIYLSLFQMQVIFLSLTHSLCLFNSTILFLPYCLYLCHSVILSHTFYLLSILSLFHSHILSLSLTLSSTVSLS